MAELEDEYDAAGHAFTVVEFGGGWQIATRPEYSPLVEKLLQDPPLHPPVQGRPRGAGHHRLPAAHHAPGDRRDPRRATAAAPSHPERAQPHHRGGSVRRPWATRCSTAPPASSSTTSACKGLGQLPDLPDLEGVIENRDDLKAFASQVGAGAHRRGPGRRLREPEPAEDDGDPAEETTDDADRHRGGRRGEPRRRRRG